MSTPNYQPRQPRAPRHPGQSDQPRAPREPRTPRDSRPPRAPRDSRPPRAPRDSRPPRTPRDPGQSDQPRTLREPREPRPPRTPRDPGQSDQPRTLREPRDNTVQQTYKPVQNKKQILANFGDEGCKMISVHDYINGCNDFETTLETYDLCKYMGVGITDNKMINDAKMTSLEYVECFEKSKIPTGKNALFMEIYGINPHFNFNQDLYKKVACMKWSLYITRVKGIINDDVINFIGFVAAIGLYLNKIDIINQLYSKESNEFNKLCKAYQYSDF
jgi:hypothetical protein